MAPNAHAGRNAFVRASVFLLSIFGLASSASAQAPISTAVGRAEVVAVAVDPQSGTIYYASDRPGAIRRRSHAA